MTRPPLIDQTVQKWHDNPVYYYRLGHIPELSLAELEAKGVEVLEHDQIFAKSSTLIDISPLGGCVYVAELLPGADYISSITDYLSTTEDKKKFVGIQLSQSHTPSSVIHSLKGAGAKKIALIEREPSIGDFKRSNQVFLTYTKSSITQALRIRQYFDQDKWAKLEDSLPFTDRKRGQINLKLARTLRNLTSNQHIFDPFCGVGRNIVACLDTIDSAFLGDVDDIAITGSHKNLAFAKEYLRVSPHLEYSRHDAREYVPEGVQVFSVVSEGWLGNNIKEEMSEYDAREAFEEVVSTYEICFKLWAKAGIKEVVLCAPFYTNLPSLNKWIELSVIESIRGGYELQTLAGKQFIYYSRPNNRVGHLIFKLQLAK